MLESQLALVQLLDIIIPSRMAALSLKRENDNLYGVDSIDSKILQDATLFLAVMSDTADPTWTEQFIRQIKVGSQANLDAIIASALPGVNLTHTQRPPNKLPVKTGYEYFRIEPKGEFWAQIVSERSLNVFVPHAFSQAKIELVMVDE